MRQLLIGVAGVLLLCVIGLLYRNQLEKSFLGKVTALPPSANTACTDEAKVCPDGSAVGRTGPNCAFATCPLPNVAISTASSTIEFVLPSGYVTDSVVQGSDPVLLASFAKASTDSTKSAQAILIHAYPTPNGETGEQVMLANTVLNPSGLHATSTSLFSTIQIADNTFYGITTERFEATVDSSYYLIRAHDVLRFEVIEKDVTSWTDPKLNIAILPEHQSLLQMLATLHISSN